MKWYTMNKEVVDFKEALPPVKKKYLLLDVINGL